MHQVLGWLAHQLAALRRGSDRGAAAVEYGLLVALIAVAIIVAVATMGGKVRCTFDNVGNQLSSPVAGATTAC